MSKMLGMAKEIVKTNLKFAKSAAISKCLLSKYNTKNLFEIGVD